MNIPHTNICTHWLKGGCRYGEKCQFAHPINEIGTIEKRGASNNAGKDGRHTAVRRLIMGEYNFIEGDSIVEVAGGKGDLSIELQNLEGIHCTLIEPRNNLKDGVSSFTRKLTRNMYHRSPVLGAPQISLSECLSKGVENPTHCRVFFTEDLLGKNNISEQQLSLFKKYSGPSKTTDDTVEENSHAGMHLCSSDVPTSTQIDMEVITARSSLQKCSLLVGLHPDGPTEDMINYALKNKKNFVVIPCCVFAESNPHRKLINGKVVRSYEDFLLYLCEKDSRIRRMTLPIAGRNIALVFDHSLETTNLLRNITADDYSWLPSCIKSCVCAVAIRYLGGHLGLKVVNKNWVGLLACTVASLSFSKQQSDNNLKSKVTTGCGLLLISTSLGLSNTLKVITCSFGGFSLFRLAEMYTNHVALKSKKAPPPKSTTKGPPDNIKKGLLLPDESLYGELSVPEPALAGIEVNQLLLDELHKSTPDVWSLITGSKNPCRYNERRPQKRIIFTEGENEKIDPNSENNLQQFIKLSREYEEKHDGVKTIKSLVVGNHGKGTKGIVLQPLLATYLKQLSEGGDEHILAQRFDHWMHCNSGKKSTYAALLDFHCRITGNSSRSLYPGTDIQLFFRLKIPARPSLLFMTVVLYPHGKCPISSYSDVDEFVRHEAALSGYNATLLHHTDGRSCKLIYNIE